MVSMYLHFQKSGINAKSGGFYNYWLWRVAATLFHLFISPVLKWIGPLTILVSFKLSYTFFSVLFYFG